MAFRMLCHVYCSVRVNSVMLEGINCVFFGCKIKITWGAIIFFGRVPKYTGGGVIFEREMGGSYKQIFGDQNVGSP